MKLDSVLALYLVDVAEHTIVNYYKATAVFISLVRDCLNELAWQKIANYKILLDFDSTDADSNPSNDCGGQESGSGFGKKPPLFTATKSACIDQYNQSGVDMIFQLSNEFCSSYLPMKCSTFDKNLAIKMMRHLCLWLTHRGFT